MSAKLGNRLKYCEIIQPVSVVRHPSCVCDIAHVPGLDLLLVVREHFVKISNTEISPGAYHLASPVKSLCIGGGLHDDYQQRVRGRATDEKT